MQTTEPISQAFLPQVNLLSEHYRKRRRASFDAASQSLGRTSKHLSSYLTSNRDCIALLDMSQEGWEVLFSNQKWIYATGLCYDGLASDHRSP